MVTNWEAWSQGRLFPIKASLWWRRPGRKRVIFLAASDLGVPDTRWDGSICFFFLTSMDHWRGEESAECWAQKGWKSLCSCMFILDFRGHIESGTSYATQLAEDHSDLKVLEGRWINQKSRRKQCQSYYYIMLLGKGILQGHYVHTGQQQSLLKISDSLYN